MISAFDAKLLQRLMSAGRATWAELAQEFGMSAPGIAERVRRLEERQIIRGFAALVDPEQTGYGLTAFIAVTLEKPKHRKGFLQGIRDITQVIEAHHIAGDYDYLLKVRAKSTRDLDELITDTIKDLPGVIRTRTTIALGTAKESVQCPLDVVEE